MVMADLRSLVFKSGNAGTSLWRMSDDEVIQHLSFLLSSGLLHVHRVPAPATATPAAQRETADQDRESMAPMPPKPAQKSNSDARPAGPVARQIEEADTFSSQTDGAATAAVLRSAAASGVPFCEECAKAAAPRKAA